MLRRMRIGGRVNLLIAVPLLALVAVSALGYVALERASVRGDEYRAMKAAQDLRADTLPAPATLLKAWADVNAIGVIAASPDVATEVGRDSIAQHMVSIGRARQSFSAAMDRWSGQQLDQSVATAFVRDGGAAGEAFFVAVDQQLAPAIDAGDPAQILRVIRSLEPLYEQQQAAAGSALFWAETEVIDREQRTDDFISKMLFFGATGAAVLILATLLLSVRVRRSIVRPIRALAARAKAVADHDLPEAVDAVAALPADAPVPRLAPFEVATHDELADLARSFNFVQDAAVDLASEQARTRRVVSDNIVNIARRNQALLGRTLGFISQLEQAERDPKVLDNLFRIDHLATRMRRNAQSLLVMAGAEPTRLWSPAVSIGDVVRAALSEVENYAQVEIGDIGNVFVQGALAPEVTHLFAELLENATAFSPPTTMVTVVGRAVPDGHQVAIFDHGLGMTPEDLNAANHRLNTVSSLDRESSKMLGFQVIAKLAARHGVNVMLTTTPGGTGVTAIIRMPKAVFEVPGTLAPDSPLGEMTESAARLTAPLPITHMDVEAMDLADLEVGVTTGEVAPVPAPQSSLGAPLRLAPAVPAVPATPLPLGPEGLTKRVRGAQLPDVGESALDAPPERAADEVRNSLASLQRGVDLGRVPGEG